MCNDIYKITGKWCQNFLFSAVIRCLPVKIRGYLPGNSGFRSVSTGYRFLNLDFNFVRYLAVTGAYRSVYRYRQKPGTALPSVSRTLGRSIAARGDRASSPTVERGSFDTQLRLLGERRLVRRAACGPCKLRRTESPQPARERRRPSASSDGSAPGELPAAGPNQSRRAAAASSKLHTAAALGKLCTATTPASSASYQFFFFF